MHESLLGFAPQTTECLAKIQRRPGVHSTAADLAVKTDQAPGTEITHSGGALCAPNEGGPLVAKVSVLCAWAKIRVVKFLSVAD
jgi:hypothetical protein